MRVASGYPAARAPLSVPCFRRALALLSDPLRPVAVPASAGRSPWQPAARLEHAIWVTPYLLGYLVNSHTFQIFVICSPPLSPWENPFESLDLPPGFGCFCAH